MTGPRHQTKRPRPDRAGHSCAPGSRLRRILAVCCLCLSVAVCGCVGIRANNDELRVAAQDGWDRFEAARGLKVCPETAQFLAEHNLLVPAQKDPALAARLLEADLETQDQPNGALALAELSYQVGLGAQTTRPLEAISSFRDAATLAALQLNDPGGARPDVAIQIHNSGVERMIRLAESRRLKLIDGRDWRAILEAQGLLVRSSTSYLAPDRLGDVRVAADLRVEGMDHVYRARGLGVPLVAHRFGAKEGSTDPQDLLYPREMRIAATAVVTPRGRLLGGEWRKNPATFALIDPFEQHALRIADREVVLACDRTTPLAMQVARGHLDALEWAGLFDSNFERPGLDAALYMLRPYEPGKIPVVFVHGLFSSPRAWVQTINELQNTPAIAARFQFWLFIYPTGMPIPGSAARLRVALANARQSLDPGHGDHAFDQMVLVGHSMGGLLAKMMAQDSQYILWDATITVPHDKFKASPQMQESLDHALTFKPLPFVKRVIFIATPHRGSPIADSPFGQFIASKVRRPEMLDERIAEIERLNGPDVICPELRGRALNAINNLRTDSPILAALDRIPIAPGVPYHSIIPLIGGTADTDGVVEYKSSHLDGAASERIVAGTHVSQEEPAVTRELDRLLIEHLTAADLGLTALRAGN